MKYLSASILALALAVLIFALMPRYYLIFMGSSWVQMGPFATQAGCETARSRIIAFVVHKDPNDVAELSAVMVCVSSR